jgi:type VII secretion integral membrane protein EccD
VASHAACRNGTEPALSGAYSPVTVVADTRRVDLALPSALPLADILPQLVEVCGPQPSGTDARRWTLCRADGHPLPADRSLAEAQVHDGEVLTLHAAPGTVRPAYVHDVRDAVEDAADAAGAMWTSRTTVRFAMLAGGLGLGLLALAPSARQAGDLSSAAPACLAAALAVGAAGWAQLRRDHGVAAFLAAVGCLWGALGGLLLAAWQGAAPAAGAVAAAGCALTVACAARAVTPYATGHVAVLAFAAAATAGVAATTGLGGTALSAVRVEAVATILVIGTLPRLSLTVGGLAGADYRVRNAQLLTQEQFARRLRDSNAVLTGCLLGCAATGAALGLWLSLVGSSWDRLLGLGVALCLVLRSRMFSQVWHVAPLRLAGLVVLVGQAVRALPAQPALAGQPVLLGAAAFALFALASVVPVADLAAARIRHLLNLAEILVVTALLPVAAAALGAFEVASELTR